MRVLVTGGTGLLGFHVLHLLPQHWHVFATVNQQPLPLQHLPHITPLAVDLTNKAALASLLEIAQPDVILHMASIGSPDKSEVQRHHTWSINVEATQQLIQAAQPYNPYILLCSTMYVFDGINPPYTEESLPNPVNFYGTSKLVAEVIATTLHQKLLVMRFAPLYGWKLPTQRHNWVTWLIEKLVQGETVQVVDDVLANHLWVDTAARAVLLAVQQQTLGMLHIGGSDLLSRYDFSCAIAEVFGFEQRLLQPVPRSFFAHLANRPANTYCSINAMIDTLAVRPHSTLASLTAMYQQHPHWWEYPEPQHQVF